jgi:hypothetical protein
VSGTPSSQHSEYTQNAWSSRTGITTALHASAASPA